MNDSRPFPRRRLHALRSTIMNRSSPGRDPSDHLRSRTLALMLDKIITGGQTGADQTGVRSAKAFGIPTGGFMPLGFRTEDGPRPEFAELYGAVVTATDNYCVRTEANV
jgi:hypothetical protein